MSTVPDAFLRPPTATPIRAYGNNVVVACPCGSISIVRSLGKPGSGAYRCGCGRALKGFPENGGRVSHVLVWDADFDSTRDPASYSVAVAPELHQAG